MTKKTRKILYVVSLVISIWVVILLLFHNLFFRPVGNQNVDELTETQLEQDTQIQETEIIETQSEEQKTEITQTQSEKEETELEAVSSEKEDVTTIIFAGDVLIADAIEQSYDAEGITALLSEELLTEMKEADICMVNNEFQFSNRGEPMEDKQYTFQTDPKYVQILKDMGVDIVSLANNHTIDFGVEALQDTFETLDKADILYAGAGNTKERAEELQIIEVNGKKFGFLAATRVIPIVEWNVENRQPGLFTTYDDTRLVSCIKEAKEVCDFLTVYIHWGIEREALPQEYQSVIAKNCVEAGADVIIGAHPHVLQSIGFIEDTPVFYSLGNYIFSSSIEKTMLVKIELQEDGEVSYQLIPASAKNWKTSRLEGKEAEALFSYMNEISSGQYVDKNGVVNK